MSRLFRVGIIIEKNRAYGRRLCEGIGSRASAWSDVELVNLAAQDVSAKDGCDGYIARIIDEQTLARLTRTGRPTVDVYCGIRDPAVLSVDVDHAAIGRMAAEHFVERSFKSCAFCGYEGIDFSDRRREAFARYLSHCHVPCAVYETPASARSAFLTGDLRDEHIGKQSDRGKLVRWLRALPKPVGIFCSQDLRAFHVISICREEGFGVPSQVAVLGVDDDPLVCSFACPTISSIDPNAFAVGELALDCLRNSLTGERLDTRPRLIKPRSLTVRKSTEVYPVEPAWLADVLVYIRRNVARNLTSADVVRHTGLSHTPVDRTFRKVLGESVQKVIARMRIEEAKHLLATTSLSAAEVSKLSGFARPQYFHAEFLTRTKMTPLEWRRQSSWR